MSSWRDERRFHLITRGNVDGIVSAALFYARVPDLKVTFVTSGSGALDALRRDIQSREFFIVDLGTNDDLVKTLHHKVRSGARVHVLDHHQQSVQRLASGAFHVEGLAEEGISAAALVCRFLGLEQELGHLAAVADVVEYCRSPTLQAANDTFGADRVAEEARMLDFAWRLQVDDDRFRVTAARRMSEGRWPSDVPEIRSRYMQVINEGRWERALDKVRMRMRVRDGVGILRFGRYRTSLYGFGTRALSHVAQEQGCDIGILVNSRQNLSSLSLRGVGPRYQSAGPGRPPLNLGRFVEEFTRDNGLTGGGHPSSAGAKIHTRDVATFLQEVQALA